MRPTKEDEPLILRRSMALMTIPPGVSNTLMWLKVALCVLVEGILIVQHTTMARESIEAAGIELNGFLADTPIVGWAFFWAPDATTRDLLAFVCAAFFVLLPTHLASRFLEQKLFTGPIPERLFDAFLIAGYVLVVAGEAMMIRHRMNVGTGWAGVNHVDPSLTAFFGLLFIVSNATAAYATASTYKSVKERLA